MASSIQLRPLTEEEWGPIQQERIAHYAEEQTRAGRWSEEEASDAAAKEYARLLPDGTKTEKHHIHGIIALESDLMVGFIWYEERQKAGKPCIFICDLQVFEPNRRRGFATATLTALEELVQREHGARRIELHVFGHNRAARDLYAGVGFEETNVIMAKELG